MTTISVCRCKGDAYRVKIDGHAGFGTCGNDIVCAGISVVTYALAEWLAENEGRVSIEEMTMDSGHVRISCFGDCRDAFDMAVCGWGMLEEAYPENVCLSVNGMGNDKQAGK